MNNNVLRGVFTVAEVRGTSCTHEAGAGNQNLEADTKLGRLGTASCICISINWLQSYRTGRKSADVMIMQATASSRAPERPLFVSEGARAVLVRKPAATTCVCSL
jgi:hypothetical protein